MEAADGPLEPLFAGLSRSPIWPQDPADPAEPAGRFFADEGGRVAGRAAGRGAAAPAGVGAGATNGPEGGGEPVGPRGNTAPQAPGQGPDEAVPASLWDAHLHGAHAHAALPPPDMPNGATVLDAARRAMEAGDLEVAAVQLALVLRVSPGLAPAVLDVAGSTAGAELDLIRGDAYRLVGHEAEAQRAYASAIATVGGAAAAPSQAAASVPPAVSVAPAESPREPEPSAADTPETP